jgi:UDP-N-acetyl-D-glucosamine dehydrogenase
MRVGVVGLGYVGLPLAVAFAEAGIGIVAVDVDPDRVAAVEAGRSYIEDVSSEDLAAARERIAPTTDDSELADVDAILICVPTPLTENREPDLSALESVGERLSGVIRRGQLVVLESTTYPGTTRERLIPLLEASGLVAGQDFHVAFSPERVDPGRTDYTLRNTPKIVGGLTPECGDRAAAVYEHVCDEIVRVPTPEIAELAKLLENIFRSVNIALVNEIAMLCHRMDIDVWSVIDAAATKPYGFMRFDPGPGMGGHCLPVDPFYLAWRARQFDTSTRFIELAGEINQDMPYHCVSRIERVLNEHGKPVKGSRVVLLGVAYKGGVGDTRESPALKIAALLHALGAEVAYHDPHVPELAAHGLASEPFPSLLEGADAAVIVTVHDGVDLSGLHELAPAVIDLRGVTRFGPAAPNVVRL